jgi:hypothetical protein
MRPEPQHYAAHSLIQQNTAMSTVYRKSLKGIDELASKSGSLPLRLTSYLLAVDGVSSTDQLASRNPHLPSMDVILNGLMQQGFIEVASVAVSANAVGARPMAAPSPLRAVNTPPAAPAFDIEPVKANMVRDVSSLLGSDAAPVINKIQNCRTRDDLFAAMMGIKKIVTMYVDKAAGDQFAARYDSLSS